MKFGKGRIVGNYGAKSKDKWFEEFGNILQANPNARAATIYKYRPDMSTPE